MSCFTTIHRWRKLGWKSGGLPLPNGSFSKSGGGGRRFEPRGLIEVCAYAIHDNSKKNLLKNIYINRVIQIFLFVNIAGKHIT